MGIAGGMRLGPYEILSPLGAGGMGEVYKATDIRLNRLVAVKVLSQQFCGNSELKQRFEREAQAIASLNHPHICVIHDVGRQDSIDYLVMEYLEGETLAERLTRGSLPIETALRYAFEISDALDKAHRQGIVHRDLKPGNIMLTKSGAKLLDFGLAKLKAGVLSNMPVSQLPTGKGALTGQGTILGTFLYMAPEQLEGQDADTRTDIFAFGAVLYEMVTGRRAFEGRSQVSLIAAILSSQPPRPSTIQAVTPPALDHIVETCLAKDPDDRFQTAHDLAVQLKYITAASSSVSGIRGPAAIHRSWKPSVVLASSLIAGAVIGALIAWFVLKPLPETKTVTRARIDLPANAPYFGGAALSPDGKHFIYRVLANSTPALRIRPLDREETSVLPGTDGAGGTPVFSYDGQWIAFAGGGKLKKIPITGGAAANLADVQLYRGAAWGPDDNIIAALNVSSGLIRVPAAGGPAQPVTKLESGELYHGWPSLLPGGRAILFASNSNGNWDEARIIAQSLDTGERHTVAASGTAPRYVSTGHVIFARAGSLFAVPFDVGSLSPRGAPFPVVNGVLMSDTDGWADFWVSESGSLIYLPGQLQTTGRSLVWVDRKGGIQPLALAQRGYEEPRFSPDGQRVALTIREGNADTWVAELARGTLTRLTFGPEEDESPIWTPDGKRITFSSSRGGKRQAVWKSADGSGPEEVIIDTEGRHQHLAAWTLDGETLISDEQGGPTGWDIYFTPYKKKEKSRPLIHSNFVEWSAQLSPDGHWLAYTSNESGRTEVFVQSFPDASERFQISSEGGQEPLWNPNGRELFYRNAEKMMVVAVETRPAFKAGVPVKLFEGQFTRLGWQRTNYDISRDGQRFLMIKGEDQPLPTSFNLVINWLSELAGR